MTLTRSRPAARRPELRSRLTPRALLWIALVLILAAAALVVVPGLGHEPFWRDETWSVTIAHRSLGGTLDVLTNREANMAPYYLLLNGWLRLGSSEGFARVPSVVFALLAIAFTAGAVRRGTGRTLPPWWPQRRSRPTASSSPTRRRRADYTLVAALAALSALALVRAVDIGRTRDWALYTAAATLLGWAHVLASLVVVAQLGSLAFHRLGPRQRRRAAASALVVGLLCLPLIGFAVLHDKGQSSWIPPLSGSGLKDAAEAIGGNTALLAVYLAVVLIVLIDAVRAARRHGRGRDAWASDGSCCPGRCCRPSRSRSSRSSSRSSSTGT